ncbi:MAG: glycerol-3-phosphate 1-O-acyltransferase PlsY [Proteobacteria bacterium]|nr:glycerol-3-phosphate 1-O-acyltransferase PlsY [Pseudomonadota bacterium]
MIPPEIIAIAIAYLYGSIPFGLLLTKFAGKGDIRKTGSGNIGATNVLRTGNKGLAAATLLLDIAKGIAAVHLARRIAPDFMAMAGFAAFLGHVYPVWLGFKGGKGVATFIGAILGLSWLAGLAGILTWALVAAVFRISSLASLVTAIAAPVYLLFLGPRISVMWAFVMTAVILIAHRENIQRLIRGEEPKIGRKSQK